MRTDFLEKLLKNGKSAKKWLAKGVREARLFVDEAIFYTFSIFAFFFEKSVLIVSNTLIWGR